MKTFKILIMSVISICFFISFVTMAYSEPPEFKLHKKLKFEKRLKKIDIHVAKDLICSISASQNSDGTYPIQNGGTISSGGGVVICLGIH